MELGVLRKRGAGIRALSRETGRSRNTVRRYVRGGDETGNGQKTCKRWLMTPVQPRVCGERLPPMV